MRCSSCGHIPDRVWWHPYIPPVNFAPYESEAPSEMPTFEKFWKCPCGQAMGGDGKPFTKYLRERVDE